MILNLLRVEEMSVESMISRSFSEFATQRALTANEYPQLLAKGLKTLSKLEDSYFASSHERIGLEDLNSYFQMMRRILRINRQVMTYIHESDSVVLSDILTPGRIILVSAARLLGCVRAPAMVLRLSGSSSSSVVGIGNTSDVDEPTVICLVLLPANFIDNSEGTSQTEKTVGYIGSSNRRFYTIREVALDQIFGVSNIRRKVETKELLEENSDRQLTGGSANVGLFNRGHVDPFSGMRAIGRKSNSQHIVSGGVKSTKSGDSIENVVRWLVEAETDELKGQGVQMDCIREYVKRGSDVVLMRSLCDEVEELTCAVRASKSHTHPSLEKYYLELEKKESLREKVETLRRLLSNESLELFPDFLQRKTVLRRLGYIDGNETVAVKGRVACEVNTCEELIATEMVFEGILNDMTAEEIVAALSALIFQEKSQEEELDSELPEKLVVCCERMKTIATNLGQLQKEAGLQVDPNEYCAKSLKFGLVHVVYEWALGVPFKNICELTDVQEGSIVRCITRLDELCREIRNCARVVGNPTLYQKLEAASVAIKRDIVFASSLYVT